MTEEEYREYCEYLTKSKEAFRLYQINRSPKEKQEAVIRMQKRHEFLKRLVKVEKEEKNS